MTWVCKDVMILLCSYLVTFLTSGIPILTTRMLVKACSIDMPSYQISNLTVVLSSKEMVCARKAAMKDYDESSVVGKKSLAYLQWCFLCIHQNGPLRIVLPNLKKIKSLALFIGTLSPVTLTCQPPILLRFKKAWDIIQRIAHDGFFLSVSPV